MKFKYTFVFPLILMASLSSCTNELFMTDKELSDKKMSLIIDTIENKDVSSLRKTFSVNANEIITQENIDLLFDYYKGNKTSKIENSLRITSVDKNNGSTKKFFTASQDVITNEETYRFAYSWCLKDSKNENNIGLSSLYIIKFNDDPNNAYDYAGDGEWTPGININKFFISNN